MLGILYAKKTSNYAFRYALKTLKYAVKYALLTKCALENVENLNVMLKK